MGLISEVNSGTHGESNRKHHKGKGDDVGLKGDWGVNGFVVAGDVDIDDPPGVKGPYKQMDEEATDAACYSGCDVFIRPLLVGVVVVG